MPKSRTPRRCALCKAGWKTTTLRDQARAKKLRAPICPSCWSSYSWRVVFDAHAGGVLPQNLSRYQASLPPPSAILPGMQRAAGAALRRAILILADGLPHAFAELAKPGESHSATRHRVRRLAERGVMREVAPQVWQIAINAADTAGAVRERRVS